MKQDAAKEEQNKYRASVQSALNELCSSLCITDHSKEGMETIVMVNMKLIQDMLVKYGESMNGRDLFQVNLAFIFINVAMKTVMNSPLYDSHALVDQMMYNATQFLKITESIPVD